MRAMTARVRSSRVRCRRQSGRRRWCSASLPSRGASRSSRLSRSGGLIDGLTDLIGSTCGPRIQVITETPHDLPPAYADANQIEMAILNLAVNARDAMPEGAG